MTFGSTYISGSTGFVFYCFYSREMLDYLRELIRGGFTYLKAYLDRGAKILYAEYKYKGDLLTAVLKNDRTI